MRKIIYLAICAMGIVSCGNKGTIDPTSKKINGPLGKFFEVVERDYKISDNELSIEFKRISEGGPTGASWSSEPTFTVEIQDEDGNSIASKHTDVVFNKEQLESVFSLGVDETTSITFKFNKDKIKDAARFKVSSKWNEGEDKPSYHSTGNNGIYDLKGSVGDYPATMHFEIEGTDVNGNYYYDKLGGPNNRLIISGKVKEDGIIDLNETTSKGKPTGHFIGRIDGDYFSGEFFNNQGKQFSFNFVKTGSVSDGDYNFDETNSNLSMDNGDDSSFDEEKKGDSSYDDFIDEYEKFYRTYIRFIKKMDKNNPTAMVEYAKLMKQYNDYAAKVEKAKGHLSTSQLNRLNKINAELIEEMQKIQNQ